MFCCVIVIISCPELKVNANHHWHFMGYVAI